MYKFGRHYSSSFLFQILDKPIPPVRRESADIQYGYIKGFVNLTCEAEAQPPATFKWYVVK